VFEHATQVAQVRLDPEFGNQRLDTLTANAG